MKTSDAIKKRISTRTFIKDSLSKKHLDQVKEIIRSAKDHTIFSSEVTLDYMNLDKSGNKEGKIGTYGIFSNHDGFIYGVCEDTKEGYLDFAYALEYIIIELTKIDIGTCWVAGTFNRKQFIQAIQKSDTQVLPAISPIGIANDKLRFIEKLAKKITKPRNRVDFDSLFFADDFESKVAEASIFRPSLEMVRIGPSAVNKQPWRIVVENDRCHIFDYKKDLKSEYKYNSLDMGIAAYHLKVSLEDQGIVGKFYLEEAMKINIPKDMYYYCSFKI